MTLSLVALLSPVVPLAAHHPVEAAGVSFSSKPIASWRVNGTGRAVLKIGNVVYVGGTFTRATSHDGSQSQPRNNLAAFDATTGVLIDTFRADVNGAVKRSLDVRKCSFLAQDDAVARTGMEFGGISPLGLPDGWRVLVDRRVAEAGHVIVGSGIRASKVALDGALFAGLPGFEVVDDLATEVA